MTIREFIKENDYFNRYRSRGSWNGYMVYHVWAKKDEGACVGYPQYALEKNGSFRLAEVEEIHAIMRNKF